VLVYLRVRRSCVFESVLVYLRVRRSCVFESVRIWVGGVGSERARTHTSSANTNCGTSTVLCHLWRTEKCRAPPHRFVAQYKHRLQQV
jgi:hypothetical protein